MSYDNSIIDFVEGGDDIGRLELCCARSDVVISGDTINSSSIGNKCPPSSSPRSRSSNPSKRFDMLELAETAREQNLLKFAQQLEHCSTDFLVLIAPNEKYSIVPMRCGSKLCPLCHAYQAWRIRVRVEEIVYRAKTLITLTISTKKDCDLKQNIDILRRAFRLMSQRKKKEQWIPFEPGYFWRMEITQGQGFHPHLHVLSTHEWIPYQRLQKRWAQCVSTAGGRGDNIWINETTPNTAKEVAKYLSKDIDFIHPERWPELHIGLEGARTHGSGRALRLPKIDHAGNRFYMYGHKINLEDGERFIEKIANCKPGQKIRPDSELQKKWRDRDTIEMYFGI